MSKEFNIDKAVQDLADYFKAEILKGNFTIQSVDYYHRIKVGKYDIVLECTWDGIWSVENSLINDLMVFTEDENVTLDNVFKAKDAELRELEKVNLAKEIAEKQKKLNDM